MSREPSLAPALLREAKALLEAADAKTAAEAVRLFRTLSPLPRHRRERLIGKIRFSRSADGKGRSLLTTEIKRLSKNEKTLLRSRNAKTWPVMPRLAVVAAGSRLSVAETNALDQEALWKECCDEFCVLSLNVNEAAHAMGNGERLTITRRASRAGRNV